MTTVVSRLNRLAFSSHAVVYYADKNNVRV